MDNQRQKKLMEENASLKKQLTDQSVELEHTRRQIEIEAALDKVRLRAGAMRSSSELEGAYAVLFQLFNETEYFYSFFFAGGTINVITNQPLTEEQCRIMIRFAQVFGLMYTRFLDLQKAETSVREAQIESALERVRARAQAMQQPEELKDVTQVFRNEMGILGKSELETCDIYIYDEKSRKSECWFAL